MPNPASFPRWSSGISARCLGGATDFRGGGGAAGGIWGAGGGGAEGGGSAVALTRGAAGGAGRGGDGGFGADGDETRCPVAALFCGTGSPPTTSIVERGSGEADVDAAAG